MKTTHLFLKTAAVGILLFVVAIGGMPAFGRSSAGKPEAKAGPADATAVARAAAKGDPLLEALLTELDRSTSTLKIDQVQRPYYLEYRVHDVEEYNTEAAFGALREDQRNHMRVLRVVVRLGDYKQDSFYNQGVGTASIMTTDNDSVALRRQIWLLTDEAYKEAADAYAEKLSSLKQFSADPNPVDDFAHAPVISAVGETVKMRVDEDSWKKTVSDLTNLYRKYPEVQSLTAAARFSATNEYLVNSEGSIVRDGRTTASVSVSGTTQAEDGMRLSRSPYWAEELPGDLPNRETLLKEATTMLDTLQALRKAPIVEESYRGPVLFTPDAADDVVAGMIGGNILGRKPQLGRPNRTTGAFATSYKTRILPKFVTVVDDPTLKEFEGKKLLGYYTVDSEGVKAQEVTVVDAGVLQNYLVNRQPIRDFPSSNGHGRSSPGTNPTPAIGTLIVKSSEPESAEELKKKALQMAGEQSKPYAYRVDTLGPGNTPRLLYRVHVSDGHEQLVRGAVFNELDIRALRNDLIALGNDPLVSNRTNGIGQTVIAPSLLFDELEVKRADTTKEKLPEYPAPEIKK
jgi:TldD protein